MKKKTCTCIIFCLLLFSKAWATDIYVTETGAGRADGSQWEHAFPGTKLERVINAASKGATIRVAAGVYTPKAVSSSFNLRKEVKVLGGYPAKGGSEAERNWETHLTILNGDRLGNDVPGSNANRTDNVQHIIWGTGDISGAVFDGFVLRNGGQDAVPYGGGVYLHLVSNAGNQPVLKNLRIENCRAGAGAGITNESSRKGLQVSANDYIVSIENIRLIGNRTTRAGGAIFNTTADMYMKDIYLEDNYSGTYGGAITNSTSTAEMVNITAINITE